MPKVTKKSIYDEAVQNVERAPDGSYREDDLLKELAKLIKIDETSERQKKAKQIIDNLSKPGGTEPDGQLSLPGFDPYDYEPERLIRDNDGNVVENSKSTPMFKTAEAQRARKNMRAAMEWSNRKSEEQERFSIWATKQAQMGRAAAELTWENCVKETGLWTPTVVSLAPSIEASKKLQPAN